MKDNRAARRLLIFVICFYIGVAVFAVCLMNLSDSVFVRRGEIDLAGYLRDLWNKDTAETEVVLEDLSEEGEDLWTEEGGELAEEGSAEPEDAEPVAGPTEEPEATAEPTVEPEPTEEPEPTVEPTMEPAEEPEHYYTFLSNNRQSMLRMRVEPSESAQVVYELKPNTEGYIIELGDEWSYVHADGHEGYCSNEYLSLTEISAAQYRELTNGA